MAATPETNGALQAVQQSYTMALAMGRGDRHMPMLADAIANFNGVDLEEKPKKAPKKPKTKMTKKKK